MTDFTIYLTPALWTLWPIWNHARWSELYKIQLGPLTIQWTIVKLTPSP